MVWPAAGNLTVRGYSDHTREYIHVAVSCSDGSSGKHGNMEIEFLFSENKLHRASGLATCE